MLLPLQRYCDSFLTITKKMIFKSKSLTLAKWYICESLPKTFYSIYGIEYHLLIKPIFLDINDVYGTSNRPQNGRQISLNIRKIGNRFCINFFEHVWNLIAYST